MAIAIRVFPAVRQLVKLVLVLVVLVTGTSMVAIDTARAVPISPVLAGLFDLVEISPEANFNFNVNVFVTRTNIYLEGKESETKQKFQQKLSPALRYYSQAVQESQAGQYPKAIGNYTDALSKDNEFAEAYMGRGRAYQLFGLNYLGDFKDNRQFISREILNTKALDTSDVSDIDKKRLGIKYLYRAIDDYTTALTSDRKLQYPKLYVDPLLGRGSVYLKLGSFAALDRSDRLRIGDKTSQELFNRAIQDFNEAIAQNPNFADAYLGRAAIYIALKQYQNDNKTAKAMRDIAEALFLKPNYPAAFLMRGSIQLQEQIERSDNRRHQNAKLQDYAKALEDFNRVINSSAQDASKYLALAYYQRGSIYLKTDHPQRAIDDFAQSLYYIQDSQLHPQIYYYIGLAQSQLQQYQKAIQSYTEAINRNSNYAEALYQRGLSYFKAESYDSSIADFTRFTELEDNKSEVYYYRGKAYFFAEKYRNAIQDLNRTLDNLDNLENLDVDSSAEIYDLMSVANFKLGNLQLAIQSCTQAIAHYPNYSQCYKNRGFFYAKQEEYQKAIQDYNRAIQLNGSDPKVYLWRGESYYKSKQYKKGAKDFRKATDLNFNLQYSIDRFIADLFPVAFTQKHYGLRAAIRSVYVSSNNQWIASGSENGKVKIWDLRNGTCKHTLKSDLRLVTAITFEPNNLSLIAGYLDGLTVRWNIVQKSITKLPKSHNTVKSLAVSPDGKILASGGYNSYSRKTPINLWDLNSNQLSFVLSNHTDDILSLDFSPDGKFLASGSKDGTVRIWNVKTQQEQRIFYPNLGYVHSVAFSPDGNILASAGKTIQLWNVATGTRIRVLKNLAKVNYTVAFSPGGKLLASGGSDNLVHLWDWQSGLEIAKLPGHEARVLSLKFSPDGTRLVSGGYDKKLIVWKIP
jgi:WD40 repeat protein